jgi:hypothetical protein
VSLRPDGLVQILSPRQEMGQGVSTAFRQIVAEELGVPLDRVTLILPRTDLLPVTPSTVGSDSMAEYGPCSPEPPPPSARRSARARRSAPVLPLPRSRKQPAAFACLMARR